jgi:hypothetical protein
MIFEKSGHIRIYNIHTFEPTYTLMSVHSRVDSLPLLHGDWCQLNPSIVISNTNSDVLLWNAASSCLPEKLVQNLDNIKTLKLAQYKENILGYVCGNDICSNIKIINFKTNQVFSGTLSFVFIRKYFCSSANSIVN